jgi:hypothetical protein
MALNAVPQAFQKIKDTQLPILQNFATIDTGFAVDHKPFVIPFAGEEGFHKQLNLLRNGTPVLNIGGYGLYVDNNGFPGTLDTTNLKLIRVGHIDTPIAGPTAGAQGTTGFSYLTTGNILKWGTVNLATGSVGVALNLPGAIDNLQVTVQGGGLPITVRANGVITNTAPGNNKITIYMVGTVAPLDVCWFAVGH